MADSQSPQGDATIAGRRERHRKVPLLPEVRYFRTEGIEVRSANKTDEIVISGTPIVYNSAYQVRDWLGSFNETMAPGVATRALENGADVRFLFNHDGLPLARSTSGTMTLEDTSDGLTFTARLDARQQLANDLAVAIERGDVSQMSCGFVVARDEWDDAEENRTIHEFADFVDVSAVTYPASPTTSISIAQRMALEMPVESRARLRRRVVRFTPGYSLTNDDVNDLRSLVTTADPPESDEESRQEEPSEPQAPAEQRDDAAPLTSSSALRRVKLANRGL